VLRRPALYESCIDSLERTFALDLAALILFLVASLVLLLQASLFQSANLCGVERQAYRRERFRSP